MKLEQYVGKLMAHTAKATGHSKRSGGLGTAPPERVFAVCDIAVDEGRRFLLAWKCDLLPDDKLSHPAFKRPLSRTDPRLFKRSASNGSQPTAMFVPDSYYRVLP